MLKRDYYLNALKANLFKKKQWVISIFSITGDSKPLKETDLQNQKEAHYPYKLFRLVNGYYFVDPTDQSKLIKIDDADVNEPLINVKDRITIKAKEVLNCFSDVETNYGNVFFNYTVLIHSFKNKIPFMTGRFSISAVEDKILEKLEDDVELGSPEDSSKIYVHEYLDFADAVSYLTGFTQLWLPTATEKALTISPEVLKLRDELFAKYKDQLTDPTILAKIDAELIKADKEWLKGDPSEGFLIKKKHFNIVRKKLFLMVGAEEGFDRGSNKADPILRSLAEGWDVNKFSNMNTVLRSGSYFRGAETALAGEQVKWLLRISSNIKIEPGDCGSKLGVVETYDEKSIKKLIGFSIVMGGKPIKVTNENAKSYVNKPVVIRSPMFCHLDKTDYCATCVGDKLSLHPTGASVAVANYGSEFLSIFLAMMHGKQLEVTDLNLEEVIY